MQNQRMTTLPSLFDTGDAVREGAGFWIRALARVLDLLVHFVAATIAGLAAGILAVVGSALQDRPPDEVLARLQVTGPLAFFVALVGATLMHTLAEGLHGSTLGKRICGLTVISEDGTPATLLGALKRSIAYLWDSFFFGLVAARKMSESPRRQRIGDIWAHTQVVRLSSLEPGAQRSFLRFALSATLGIAVDGTLLFTEIAFRLV